MNSEQERATLAKIHEARDKALADAGIPKAAIAALTQRPQRQKELPEDQRMSDAQIEAALTTMTRTNIEQLAKWCEDQANDPDNKEGAVTLLVIAETLRNAALSQPKALAFLCDCGEAPDHMPYGYRWCVKNGGRQEGVTDAVGAYEPTAGVSLPRQSEDDSLRERLQQKCYYWGAYWRAPDAHGVECTYTQALELLSDALGVEVDIITASRRATPPAAQEDEDIAMHWIDRYAAGIDDVCQLDRVRDALFTTPAAPVVGDDTKRLDWLDANPRSVWRSAGYREHGDSWSYRNVHGCSKDTGTLRDAIDHAIQAAAAPDSE